MVVIQYRLGLFGFLPGAEVKSGGALNAGLREFWSWEEDNKLSLCHSGSDVCLGVGASPRRYWFNYALID